MNRELKATPCPFCGSNTVSVFEYAGDAAELSCNGCNVQMAANLPELSHLTPTELVVCMWESRHDPQGDKSYLEQYKDARALKNSLIRKALMELVNRKEQKNDQE